jgi:S-adenosylmethionine decarboxylase
MFVWPHKIILKTCGTTTLLLGLRRMLEIAKDQCGYQAAWRCFYSRKAFMFPERQIGPHKTWDDEVKYLDREFGKLCSRIVQASVH